MIVTIPSGSQMDRIVRCPASAALPQIHDTTPEDGRDRGLAMHKYLDRVAAVGREVALAEVDEKHRAFCSDIEIAKLADRLKLSTEVALAYNWRNDTARRLVPLEHRAYEVDPTSEIPLTIDLAGFGDGVVYSGDYKSGHGWLPAPHQSMQLGLGALALARLHKARKATLEYIRIRDDGTPLRFDATLDTFGLEAAAERTSTAMLEVEKLRFEIDGGITPNVVEGPHCRYCPARQHCPAKTAMVRKVLGDQPIPYLLPLTPENVERAYGLLKKAREAISVVEGAIYAYAKTTPIPLGEDEDGSLRYFGELRRPGNEELDGAKVHQVLTELYSGEVANEAVSMEATKAAITNAIRKVLPAGEKITHHTAKVYKLVGERGGSKHPETCTTTEYTLDADGTAKARKRKSA